MRKNRYRVMLIGVMISSVDSYPAEGLPIDDGCNNGATLALVPKDDWMETEVIMGFRVWQLMFLALAGLITVVVLLCCFMKCRVPRTKQEIEADFKRKEITRRFRFLLDRVQIEDTSLRTAIEKVNELYSNREKMKHRKKKKAEDEEEIISLGSSYLFVDEKLTIKQRVKKLLGFLDDNVSETDSMKETTDKSEDPFKRSTSVDELSSLPDVKIVDPIKTRQPSEESYESPKLVDSHSKLSLLLDSPPRTHDTLSRVTLLEDSPPNYGITPLHMDTPILPVKATEQESIRTSDTGSKPVHGKNKTDSQDSERSVEKEDSADCKKNPLDLKQKSGSQESGSNTTKKSDSQDSESGHYRKQKSDSQETNDSFDSPPEMNKPKFQPQESKLTRRESMGGQSGRDIMGHKWRKSPKPKSINEPKTSQSLDVNLSSKS